MAGIINMNAPALTLAGFYAVIILLLLSLHLKSDWPWSIKTVAIGLTLPAGIGAFLALQSQLGWPSKNALPSEFQLHAALVEEPATGNAEDGAIFLWLTPWQDVVSSSDDADIDAAMLPDRRPRAFDLPYSRDLHQKVETM
ncbi:MAG: hypothetical protein AAGA21_10280 [Pseudomonadota bacterium]